MSGPLFLYPITTSTATLASLLFQRDQGTDGSGWILTAPVELGVMEYKQEDIRGELDGIKPSSLYERTTHSPIMCRAYQITE